MVHKFKFPIDFVILDCEIYYEVSIIIGRPFLAIKKVLVDLKYGKIKFWVNNEEVALNVCTNPFRNQRNYK